MKVFGILLAGFFIIWAYFSCAVSTSTPRQTANNQGNQVNTVVNESAADGLDLELLIPMVQEAKNAEELEKLINKKDGVNNLDLNNDGNVDFLKVTEFGSKEAYGFSLTAHPAEGEEQEVATIEIKREGEDKAVVQVAGNQQIYGANHYHHSSFGVTNWLLLAYLMRPHPFYVSPYRYGYYPSYYSPYRYRSYNNYRSYSKNRKSSFWSSRGKSGKNYGVTRSYKPINTGIKSPNAGKVATTGIRKSLSSPTTAQKSFRTREASKAAKSGGFGRNATANKSSSRSSGRSGSVRRSSSSRGFGGRGK